MKKEFFDAEWLSSRIEELDQDVDFNIHRTQIDLSEQIARRMSELGMNRTALAQTLTVSKPFITKLLSGSANLTLRTLVAVALALRSSLKITFVPHAAKEGTSLAPVLDFYSHLWKQLDAADLGLSRETRDAEATAGS